MLRIASNVGAGPPAGGRNSADHPTCIGASSDSIARRPHRARTVATGSCRDLPWFVEAPRTHAFYGDRPPAVHPGRSGARGAPQGLVVGAAAGRAGPLTYPPVSASMSSSTRPANARAFCATSALP